MYYKISMDDFDARHIVVDEDKTTLDEWCYDNHIHNDIKQAFVAYLMFDIDDIGNDTIKELQPSEYRWLFAIFFDKVIHIDSSELEPFYDD